MVARGLARSRAEAQALIAAGNVTVGGAPAGKPATMVAADQPIACSEGRRWASRGGWKLEGALDEFEVEVAGRRALDAGASTGGFTDVLLARAAASVIAVDVGYGQLDWRLRDDERVTVLDRTNARHLTADQVPPPAPSLVVADLSFISLSLVLPALADVADPAADFVLLVKPQFEVGAERVGRGGVVADPRGWHDALARVVAAAAQVGLGLRAATVSPLRGPAGNVEFFVHLSKAVDDDHAALIERAVSLASDP